MPRLNKRYIGFLVLTAIVVGWISIRPSNDRDWSTDQAILPSTEIKGNLVHIKNIRNFTYRTRDDYDVAYYDKTFDLNKINTLWYVVEPFSNRATAHTFLSFGFDGPEYVSISVEIRKEKGEAFSAIGGFFKRYELMYVIGDERDVVQLRTNIRKDDVYLYPVKAPKEKIQELFLSMLARANELKEKPEWYNTLWNTCTTNIVRHINHISPKRIPFSYKVLLPGYSDQLAYDLGLIDTDLPFEEIREQYHINKKAMTYADDPEFSVRIREQSASKAFKTFSLPGKGFSIDYPKDWYLADNHLAGNVVAFFPREPKPAEDVEEFDVWIVDKKQTLNDFALSQKDDIEDGSRKLQCTKPTAKTREGFTGLHMTCGPTLEVFSIEGRQGLFSLMFNPQSPFASDFLRMMESVRIE